MRAFGLIQTIHVTALLFTSALGPSVVVPSEAQINLFQKETPAANHAAGPFDVKLTPQEDKTETTLGRMTIDSNTTATWKALENGRCSPPRQILRDQVSTWPSKGLPAHSLSGVGKATNRFSE